MIDNEVIILESSDKNKKTMNIMFNFLNSAQYYDLNEEKDIDIHSFLINRTGSVLDFTVDVGYRGKTEYFYLTENLVPTIEKQTNNPYGSLKVKFSDIIQKVKYVDFVSIALTTNPVDIVFKSEYENITSRLELVYGKDGKIYKLSDNSLVPKVYQTYVYAYSLQPYPGTVFFLNNDFVVSGLPSFFAIPSTHSIAHWPDVYDLPIIPTITSKIESRIGNYKVITKEDTFSFTIFGDHDEVIELPSSKKRVISHEGRLLFKLAKIDINKVATIKSKYPATLTEESEVILDISKMKPGEATYVAAYLDMGEFYKSRYASNIAKNYFEFVVIKDFNENTTYDTTNTKIVLK